MSPKTQTTQRTAVLLGQSHLRSSELFTNRRLRTTIMTCTLLMLTRASSTVETALIVPDFNEPSVFVLSVMCIMFTGSVCGLILTAFSLSVRWGRRRMLISLLCGIFVFRLGLSLSLPNQLVQVVIIIISSSCFVSLHVAAELIFTVYISEVFPLYYRGKMDPMRIRERVSDLKIEMGVAFTISFFYACVAILSITSLVSKRV